MSQVHVISGLLLAGHPGAGKTPVERALPSLQPRMDFEEAPDMTRVYSVADLPPL
jgi:magnesium chelatase family protein